jgi:hypothetical protein
VTDPHLLTSAEVVAVHDCPETVHHAAPVGPTRVMAITLAGDVLRLSGEDGIEIVARYDLVPTSFAVTPVGHVVGHGGGAIITARGYNELISRPDPVVAIASGRTTIALASGADVVLGAGDELAAGIGVVRDLAWLGRQDLFVAVGTKGLAWLDLETLGVEGVVHLSTLLSVAAGPDGERVAAGSLAGAVHVIDAWGGEGFELEGYPDRVRHVSWLCGGDLRGVVAVADDEITMWSVDAEGCADEPVCLYGHDEAITALEAAPAAGLVASGDASGSVRIWRPDRVTEPLAQVTMGSSVTALVWTADCQHLAVFDRSGQVAWVAVRLGLVA